MMVGLCLNQSYQKSSVEFRSLSEEKAGTTLHHLAKGKTGNSCKRGEEGNEQDVLGFALQEIPSVADVRHRGIELQPVEFK
jgi:hypothetical protein